MKFDVKKKVHLIFLPFIFLGITFTTLYNTLYWLICLKWQLLDVSEEVVYLGLPFIILGLLVFFWLWPRIKLLNMHHTFAFSFALVAFLSIGFPSMDIQKYLKKESGELTQLTKISHINEYQKTQYYKLENYFVAKHNVAVHMEAEWKGEYNDRLQLTLFIALPIYDSVVGMNPAAWLGFKYETEMKSHLSEYERERKVDAFIQKSEEDLNSKNVQKFAYLDRIGSSNALDGYTQAIRKNSLFNTDNDIVLIPVDTPFEERNQGVIESILRSWLIGFFLLFVILLFPKFDEEKLKIFQDKAEPGIFIKCREYLFIFTPQEGYFITPLLMNLIIITFMALFFLGFGFKSISTDALLQWGANYGPYIDQGEYWRLITSNFLHDGIIHLASNVFALMYLGICLEAVLGKFKFLVGFIISGILASLASYYWSGAISVGASGAILGLSGLGLVLLNMREVIDYEVNLHFLRVMTVIAVGSLLMGFIFPNIDNAAHIGGFLGGCVMGLLIAKFGKLEYIFGASE